MFHVHFFKKRKKVGLSRTPTVVVAMGTNLENARRDAKKLQEQESD